MLCVLNVMSVLSIFFAQFAHYNKHDKQSSLTMLSIINIISSMLSTSIARSFHTKRDSFLKINIRFSSKIFVSKTKSSFLNVSRKDSEIFNSTTLRDRESSDS